MFDHLLLRISNPALKKNLHFNYFTFPKMKFLKNNSVLSSLIIAVAISVFTSALWTYGDKLVLFMRESFSPEQTKFAWWKLSFIVFAAIVFGLLTEIKSFKKVLPYALIFSFVWLIVGFLLAKYKNIDLLVVPVILTSFLTITLVHLKKLWQID